MTELQSISEDFAKALMRFEEVLQKEKSDIIRDSALKRFEIIFDLSWKTIKEILNFDFGIQCASPKACFREAYRQKLIEYSEKWLIMTEARNKTAHLYNEKLADEIYDNLKNFLPLFRELAEIVKKYQK